MGDIFFLLGYLGSGILAYGLEKNYLIRRFGENNQTSDVASIAWMVGIMGYVGLVMVIVDHRREGWELSLTYRIPKQEALPAPDRKDLIIQTSEEKVLAAVETAEKEHVEEEKEKERQLVLAEQRKSEQALQKEIFEKSVTLSKLMPQLSKDLLKMKPKHLEGFREEEYQHLDTIIKKRIGLGHKISEITGRLTQFLCSLECKIIESSGSKNLATGVTMFIGYSVIGVIPALIGILLNSTVVFLASFLGMVIGVLLSALHYRRRLDDCPKCYYLESSKFLRKHQSLKFLPFKKKGKEAELAQA